MDPSPSDEGSLTRAEFLARPIDGDGKGAVLHIDRLFEPVMAVRWRDESTDGDNGLEDGGGSARIDLVEEKPDREGMKLDGGLCIGAHLVHLIPQSD